MSEIQSWLDEGGAGNPPTGSGDGAMDQMSTDTGTQNDGPDGPSQDIHIPFVDCDSNCPKYVGCPDYPYLKKCGLKCSWVKGHDGVHKCDNDHQW